MRSLYRAALAAAIVSLCPLVAAAQVVGSVPVIDADRANSGSITTAGAGQCPAGGGTGCVILNAPGTTTALVTISGTWNGLQEFDCQKPDTTWVPISAQPYPSGGAASTTTAANGTWAIQYAGCSSLRVFANSLSSGTAVVSWEASASPLQLAFPAAPLAPPAGANIQQWGGMNVLFGPGPGYIPGIGAAPRIELANDSNAPVTLDHTRPTYRWSASFTPQATGAVTLLSVQGSVSRTVRITRILLSGHSTANAQETFALQRTSALGAGGTVVAASPSKLDTNYQPASAVVQHYTTTVKAAGTGVGGPASTFDFFTGVVTTPTVTSPWVQIYPELGTPGQSFVLRGTADFLELQNVNGGNLSAGTVLQYVVEAVEDGS